MSLFRRAEAPQAPQPTGDEARGLVMPVGPSWSLINTYAGKPVGFDSAMRNAAFYACSRVLAASAVTLPIDVVRQRGNAREQVNPQPMIVRSPSGRVNRRAWVGQVMRSLVGDGNAYGFVVATDLNTGRPTQIETIHPSKVTWLNQPGADPSVMVDGTLHELWPRGPLWHLPVSFLLQPGDVKALSPIDAARDSIGTALAAEEFGARFFGDGGMPTAIIKSSQTLNDQQVAQIKANWKQWVSGRREPAVVGGGLEYTPIDQKLSETQFVDLLQFEVLNACRFTGVPPAMVFAAVSGQNVTYANITDADLFYLKHSLAHWLTDFEAAWSDMIVAPQVVKFNVDAVLRMDTLKRYQVHEIALRNRLRTVNEVRRLEDEDPFPGDEFNQPGIPGAPSPSASPAGAAADPQPPGATV